KNIPLLSLLLVVHCAPKGDFRSRDDSRMESMPIPPSLGLPINDTPATSIAELEAKLNERMRIMYVALSSRMDNMEDIVHDVKHSNENGEWLERDDQSRYRMYEIRRNWKEAQSICQSHEASLVTVDSEKENAFLTQIVKTKPHVDFVWLKMKNRPVVTPLDVQFSNMTERDRPNQCTVLSSDASWSLRSCDQLRPFICKRDPPMTPSPKRRLNSDEYEVDEVLIHPTLKQPIQPWNNRQLVQSGSSFGSNGGVEKFPSQSSFESNDRHNGRSDGTPKRALDFLFQ
ncbi:hypothetical protein PFISCL1PPCAC_5786, partial [Pristionchus fissidentatus]